MVITPGVGYQISYGDRNHFSNNGIKIEKNVNQVFVYIRDASTYEQTDVITINGFKIDSQSPKVEDMTSGEVYFADENGSLTCIVKDENLSHVVINGNKVDLTAKLFNEIAPAYAGRVGGYTRIIKKGPRRGDAAEVVILKLV